VRRQGTREQRTLHRTAEVRGIGFLTGASIQVRFQPAPANTGIVFVRTDLPQSPRIRAHLREVTGTARRTTLGHPPCQVELVEHALSALAGLRIDNCLVELNAAELPGLDGSARGFVDALLAAGVVRQAAPRDLWTVTEPLTVRDGQATLTLHPGSDPRLRLSYLLDYGPLSPIAPQRFTEDLCPEMFRSAIQSSRTFLLHQEAEALRRQGIGSRTTLADLLVFGPHGPLENRLRFADEPARHKALDIIGDLSLLGVDLCGHVIGCRSGHALNIELVRQLAQRLESGVRAGGRLAA
jgi:UDP-3-O-acyl N-acetylglucosamine deacetylase